MVLRTGSDMRVTLCEVYEFSQEFRGTEPLRNRPDRSGRSAPREKLEASAQDLVKVVSSCGCGMGSAEFVTGRRSIARRARSGLREQHLASSVGARRKDNWPAEYRIGGAAFDAHHASLERNANLNNPQGGAPCRA